MIIIFFSEEFANSKSNSCILSITDSGDSTHFLLSKKDFQRAILTLGSHSHDIYSSSVISSARSKHISSRYSLLSICVYHTNSAVSIVLFLEDVRHFWYQFVSRDIIGLSFFIPYIPIFNHNSLNSKKDREL